MDETRFTQGEWFVQGDFIKSIVDGIPKNICHVFGRPQDIMMGGKTEARSNAELISAAPELYYCLKEAVNEMCHVFPDGDWGGACKGYDKGTCKAEDGKCFVQKWIKALKKARGEEK